MIWPSFLWIRGLSAATCCDERPFQRLIESCSRQTSVLLLDSQTVRSGYPLRTVWLSSSSTDVCLEQLSISRWNGRSSQQVAADKPRIHKKDGQIIYGDVNAYAADQKQFV